MRRIAAAEDLRDLYDLAVIGAGPAGMTAAATAAEHGLSVLLVDENAGPGGQIYRAITSSPIADRALLGAEYWAGAALAEALARSPVDYAAGARLFSLLMPGDEETRPGLPELGVSLGGMAQTLQAREVVIATGALERPFPIPGWTLPGVLTAGAAQTALKASGLVPDGRVVLAGTGPLLLLVAAQLRAAGARIDAVLDTTPAGNRRRARRHAAGFLRSPYLAKGLRLLARARGGPAVIRGVTGLRAEGTERVHAVTYWRGGGAETIDCDVLLLHQGVVPNTVVTNALGCAHAWDEMLFCWAPRLDFWLRTSVPGVSVAGDGGGIAGAEAAAESGKLAALGAATRLGKLTEEERDRRAAPIRAALSRWLDARRFLDALYRPGSAFRVPQAAETIVCRCEEVTAGQIRDAVARGATGPNQLKVFTRCGMGPVSVRRGPPTGMALNLP